MDRTKIIYTANEKEFRRITMRKKCLLLLFLAVCLALAPLLGCKAAEKERPKEIAFAVQDAGSETYALGVKICDLITRYTEITATASPTGGSRANAALLRSGEVQMALLSSMDVYNSYRGTEAYKDEGKLAFWQIAGLNTKVFVCMVRKDSDIKSPADFRGKRFAYHLIPSPITCGIAEDWLEVYGMTPDDVITQKIATLTEGETLLREGGTDIAVRWLAEAGATPAVQELALTVGIRLISLTNEDVDKIIEKRPYFARGEVKAGTYKGQDYPLVLVGHILTLCVNRDLPESLVYEMTKAVFEHVDELHEVHAAFEAISVSRAVSVVRLAGVSPGSVKYYKEKGVWGDKEEKEQKAVLAEIGM